MRGAWLCVAALGAATLVLANCGNGVLRLPAAGPPPNPTPAVTTLSPSSTAAGDPAFTLTVNGSNFISTSVVEWNGSGRVTTFVNSGDLQAAITAADIATAGTAQVTVLTPAPGGGSSNAATFTVSPQPLAITTTSLPNGTVGTAYSATLQASGGVPPYTWSISSGSLPAGLSLAASTGGISGTPATAGTSNFTAEVSDSQAPAANTAAQALSIAITASANAVPFINQPLVPDTASPGGAGFTLTVNGTGFVSGAAVDFNSTALATAFVSDKQLTAAVPSAAVAGAATASITAVNPTPGGGRSNVVFFPVASPETAVSFSNATGSPVTVGNNPFWVAVGDFNGDGKLDLAVSNFSDTTVTILLGNGDGTFTQAPGSPIPVGKGPEQIAVADFNGDGKLDLAVPNLTDSTVTILLGNGDGTFTQAAGSPIAVAAYALAVGDFNGDGKLDLAVANNGSGLTILLGNGDGTFTRAPGSPITVGSSAEWVTVGDFNGDGKLDLAVANGFLGDTVTILLGNGDGTFTQAPGSPITVGNGPDSIAVGDFNGDGKLDLAVTNGFSDTATVLLGKGDGTFTQAPGSPIAVGAGANSVAAADFNGDGKLDLVVTNPDSFNVTLLLGNGDGTFTQASGSPFAAPVSPGSVAVGDFNGDGRLDFATSNFSPGASSVAVLLQP